MSLESAGSSIGPNNFEMMPFGDQEFSDFCTGEILISAERARADFQSTYAGYAGSPSIGPGVSQEIADSAPQSNLMLISQSPEMLAAAINSDPTISEAAIQSAPAAYALGSPDAPSPFTRKQLRPGSQNWSAGLTIAGATENKMRRNQVRRITAMPSGPRAVPGPLWGSTAGSVPAPGYIRPWGKLFLFVGLGLIGASLLDRS